MTIQISPKEFVEIGKLIYDRGISDKANEECLRKYKDTLTASSSVTNAGIADHSIKSWQLADN